VGQRARIKKNAVFAFLSRLIRLLTNFLLFIGIARLYGLEAFGQFTTAHTLATIFLLLADFGFDSLLPTEIARQRERAAELAQRYFSLKVIFAAGACVGMIALPFWQHLSPTTRTLVEIFSLYVVLASFNNFFFALFKGFEEFHHETKISFATNLSLLVLLIVLGVLHAPLYVLAFGFVGTRVIGVVLGSRTATRLTKSRVMLFNFDGWKEIWRRVVVFGLHFVFGALFFQLDTVLLAFWRGDHDVGIYQSAFKIATLGLIVPDIAIRTMMPVLSRLHGESGDRWISLGRLLNKTLFLIGLPVSMILFVYAEQLIHLVYGTGGFSEAIPILRLFAATVFVRFSVEAYALMLTTSRRQTILMFVVIAGTVVNYVLNFFIIPTYGPMGAAYVSLTTNILVGAGYVIASRHSFVQWTCDPRNLVSLVITGILALVMWNFRTVPLWYTCPIVIGLYALVFYYIGYTREEWKMVFVKERSLPVS